MISVHERFWSKVDKNGPVPITRPELGSCWAWTRSLNTWGYAQFGLLGKQPLAHRLAYEWNGGIIPSGYTLDHLCRNRACVRPSHLEVVTNGENVLRGIGLAAENARKTHCIHGHEYTEENTKIRYGGRDCRICCRERVRQYMLRKNTREPRTKN